MAVKRSDGGKELRGAPVVRQLPRAEVELVVVRGLDAREQRLGLAEELRQQLRGPEANSPSASQPGDCMAAPRRAGPHSEALLVLLQRGRVELVGRLPLGVLRTVAASAAEMARNPTAAVRGVRWSAARCHMGGWEATGLERLQRPLQLQPVGVHAATLEGLQREDALLLALERARRAARPLPQQLVQLYTNLRPPPLAAADLKRLRSTLQSLRSDLN